MLKSFSEKDISIGIVAGIVAIFGLYLRLHGCFVATVPPELVLQSQGNQLSISSEVGSEADRQLLQSAYSAVFNQDIPEQAIQVNNGTSALSSDISSLMNYFNVVKQDVNNLNFHLIGNTITISGQAIDEPTFIAIGQALQTQFPNLVVTNQLSFEESNLQEDINTFLEGKIIAFQTGSAELKVDSYVILNEIASMIKRSGNSNVTIEIQGHTDNQGNDNANLSLSENRAKSVKDYLVAQGLREMMFESKGFGETMPIADNNTEAGRTANRRVAFIVR